MAEDESKSPLFMVIGQPPEKLRILVTGATGTQGRAVAGELIRRGHDVLALTRHPESIQARILQQLGVQVIRGDFDDADSLLRVLRRVEAVYAVGTPANGAVSEVRQQCQLANLARFCGVRHYLYSSIAGARSAPVVPWFQNKAEIERHIEKIGIPLTIVAPALFMENLIVSQREEFRRGLIRRPMPARRTLHQIAVRDVASFCALVFENPKRFLGQRFEIASDEISGEEQARIFTEVTGREIRYEEIPLRQGIFDWVNRTGFRINVRKLRYEFPEVRWRTFEHWVCEQDWRRVLDSAA